MGRESSRLSGRSGVPSWGGLAEAGCRAGPPLQACLAEPNPDSSTVLAPHSRGVCPRMTD